MAGTLSAELAANGYPGRGILVARTADDGLCIVYFMTGRSPASRDRALVRDDGSLYARARSAADHDPLRHYRSVAVGPRWCVVGNGDQVDVITANLESMSPTDAVQGIDYEPDPPLRTPRISVVAPRDGGPVVLAASRASVLNPATTKITCLTLGDLAVGCGVLTTTYRSRGTEVVDTSHPPVEVSIDAVAADELLAEVWGALPADLRVAAAVVQPTLDDPRVIRAILP
ncbi:MAG: IMP cyclohydrolase [Microlunatus sp.]